ncbi:glycosyltransferase family 25 protein [Pseudothioclava nitratireducens]|uniref:glycosyltransferase family 25 protein n=1 Tax=Pseudothioclava nitratireducens TaxID=1928646 RepID=UPI0023DCD5A2|nr:glycosyltransferase family 25 protein [Defluviimonas nitratireducens]MDF1621761.1 glycosyltransferase family 25 protein [Defluviimonas nitratireducens]
MTTPCQTTDLKVYLINLDRATERLARMTYRLNAVPLAFERVPAVDGRSLTFPTPDFSELSFKLLHGRRRIPSEVGCYLSHVECARRLLATDARYALILEDDVAFSDDFAEVLEAAVACSASWDILRLSELNTGPKLPYAPLIGQRNLAVALLREKGAGAYVINRRAAEWFVKRLVPMRLSWDIAFDLEYLSGLRASFVYPVPADQRTETVSQIQNDVRSAKLPRWRYLSVLPYRAYLESTRVVMRLYRLIRLRVSETWIVAGADKKD